MGNGAYATQWEGWVEPKLMNLTYDTATRVRRISQIDDLAPGCGCYAVLYRPGPESSPLYCAYLGFGEIKDRLKVHTRTFELSDSWYRFQAIYISRRAMAEKYEWEMLRYYCPPWNTSFK